MLLDDIGDYLTSGGAVTEAELFRGYMPESPDSVVSLYESGGMGPIRAMRTCTGHPVAVRPRLMVVARAPYNEYQAARLKVQQAYDLLEHFGGSSLNGVGYKWIGAVNEPHLIGKDEQGRLLVGCDFDVIKERSTA